MKFWIKAVVTLALVTALLVGIEWREIAHRLATIEWGALTVAAVVMALQLPANAWKWGFALRLHDRVFRHGFLLKVCCIAYFFNNFLPSGIGGDAYRVYRTLSETGEKSTAISAVLVERLVGFSAMLALGVLGAAWLAFENLAARTFLVVVLVAGSAAALGLLSIYVGWLEPLASRLRRWELFRTIEATLRLVVRRHRAWPWLIVASFFFQVLVALWMFSVFAAIGQKLGPAECVLISAAAGLGSLLPISISGLGVIEGSIAGAATALGVPYETAVLGALLNRLGLVPFSVACGFVYLLDRGTANAAAGAASE